MCTCTRDIWKFNATVSNNDMTSRKIYTLFCMGETLLLKLLHEGEVMFQVDELHLFSHLQAC